MYYRLTMNNFGVCPRSVRVFMCFVWISEQTALISLKIVQNVKGKAVPVHAVKAYRGTRGIAPLILNLGTRWRWVVNFTPRPLYPRKINPVRTEEEAGLAPEPAYTVVDSITGSSTPQLVAMPTTLYLFPIISLQSIT
jgi:hypothetical protein